MKVRKQTKGRHTMLYRWYRYCAYSTKEGREAARKWYEYHLEQERLTGVHSPFIDFYEEDRLIKQNNGV